MSELLPRGHLFSQHSLNTYLRCRRRFLLKYVDRQPWPCPERQEPGEYRAHLERGRTYHQWIARDQLGLPMDAMVAATPDVQLQSWWAAYKTFDWDALPEGLREAELPVVVPLGDYRLYARYDLLAADVGGDAVIVDWKTLDRLPSRQVLDTRAQTRVYLYTLVEAGHVLTDGAPVAPERASMMYWFANRPDAEASVAYSRQRHARDGDYLRTLVQEIVGQERGAFECTDDRRQCVQCAYRTLCDRTGESEGPKGDAEAWLDEDLDLSLDSDAVEELAY